MNIKQLFVMGGLAAAGFGVAVFAGHAFLHRDQPVLARAQWTDVYETSGGLIAGADLIVEVELLNAAPGRTVGEGWSATPFTNNRFRIVETLKGAHHGQVLTVEQTGGALDSGVIMNIDDGGPFEKGVRYLLFLKNKGEGDGMYYQINHQARYKIYADMLEGVDPEDPVVKEFHWQRMKDSRDLIKAKVRDLR